MYAFYTHQDCERTIARLQYDLLDLKQDKSVLEMSAARKDSLLLQAKQQWTKFDEEMKARVHSAISEKDQLQCVIILRLCTSN